MSGRFSRDDEPMSDAVRKLVTEPLSYGNVDDEPKAVAAQSVERVDRGWLIFIRAAELALRTGAEFRVDRLIAPRRGWHIDLYTDADVDINAPTSDDESEQLAELTAGRWMERMRGARSVATSLVAGACATCNVRDGQPCRPMHDGERDPGAWAHPGRRFDSSESEIVLWARSVKRGEQTELLPGMAEHAEVRHDARAAIGKVVDEILLLAYINDAMLAPVRGRDENERRRLQSKLDLVGDGPESRRSNMRAPTNADGRSALQRTRDNMTKPVPFPPTRPTSPTADASACGCTWGSPCDEHGPYW